MLVYLKRGGGTSAGCSPSELLQYEVFLNNTGSGGGSVRTYALREVYFDDKVRKPTIRFVECFVDASFVNNLFRFVRKQ